MEHYKSIIATLVCAIVISCLMAVLFISSNANIQLSRTGLCGNAVPCDSVPKQSPGTDIDNVPTLAPPRLNSLSATDGLIHATSLGQTVYVQVKTDHVDIEVGWASADFMDR
jgi:hypothetical protein